jgi:hypothetical protein
MEPIELSIPQHVVDLLPQDGANAATDMEKAVEGYERHLNRSLGEANDPEKAAEVLDVVDHMEARMETYDTFVPELRAWGQSPAYAVAWRNLHGELISQIYQHEVSGLLDRERNYRIADDGIRLKDLKED